ncbi:MAG: hypothetical protein K8R17_08475 [Methanosarcinales archaeon]|nr:hypothetical protein [Methanosarcinales archaeon]
MRHLCKAVCCKFPFVFSRQDVEEGAIRWEFDRPYLIAHDDDGSVFIWIGRTTGVWYGSSGLYPAGDLTVRIMKNGRCGRIL